MIPGAGWHVKRTQILKTINYYHLGIVYSILSTLEGLMAVFTHLEKEG